MNLTHSFNAFTYAQTMFACLSFEKVVTDSKSGWVVSSALDEAETVGAIIRLMRWTVCVCVCWGYLAVSFRERKLQRTGTES